MKLASVEAVSKYHPDKYADQIADAIVTECLRQDHHSRCGVEVMVKDSTVVLGGEVSTTANVDYQGIVKRVASKLGYRAEAVINLIGQQSREIHEAVDSGDETCAGDQGIMFGYAHGGTKSMLHPAFDLANRIIARLEETADETWRRIRGEAKVQVVFNPEDNSIQHVVVSVCHSSLVEPYLDYLVKDKLSDLVDPSLVTVNPGGSWTIGGPTADCGMTGRKIVCDQYGGVCAVGGGAFSGKDPSKVDRTAAYMAREIACDLVREFDLEECSVQLGYVIGDPEPVSVWVSNDPADVKLTYVLEHYDLTVDGMIRYLGLLDLDCEELAEGCHFFDKETYGPRRFHCHAR